MSEHPIDVLRKLASHASSCPVGVLRGWDCTCGRDAALSEVEQLEQAAREADAVLHEHMPEWYGDREWPELDALRAALALFDRKEQTP